jgi:hypothetical protein
LIARAEASRARLGHDFSRAQSFLDVPGRLKSSLKENPSRWLFGSVASGFLASLVLRRPGRAGKKILGMPTTLLGLILTGLRPLLKVWFAEHGQRLLTDLFESRGRRPAARSYESPSSSQSIS